MLGSLLSYGKTAYGKITFGKLAYGKTADGRHRIILKSAIILQISSASKIEELQLLNCPARNREMFQLPHLSLKKLRHSRVKISSCSITLCCLLLVLVVQLKTLLPNRSSFSKKLLHLDLDKDCSPQKARWFS